MIQLGERPSPGKHPDGSEYLQALARLREATRSASEAFLAEYEADIERYRNEVSAGIVGALERLRLDVGEITGNNRLCAELTRQASGYVEWLQWCLWDLPYFAVARRPEKEEFRAAVAACGMVYLSLRVFDDLLDRHFWYKGKRPTLLSVFSETPLHSQETEGLTLLAGLLLSFDGLARLAGDLSETGVSRLKRVTTSIRRAIIGAIMEQSDRAEWDPRYYERLVQLKNVDYWKSLYAAIDPDHLSPLYSFLEAYYALAQMLNDVQDYAEDEQRGQPNLVSLYLPRDPQRPSPCSPRDGSPTPVAPAEVERLIAEQFMLLGEMAAQLPEPERSIALFKLGESLDEAHRIGLFASPSDEAPPEADVLLPPLQLGWYSELEAIVERVGPAALCLVECAVCGSSARKFLFRKQGFSYHRCADCSHIYVSPRISADLQGRISQEADEQDAGSEVLAIQKMYAGLICDLLHSRAEGRRLLDIGFGRGRLMQVAQAYGFEVYGVDISRAQVDHLWPDLGKRVYRTVAGEEVIPWDSFDAVVMSHVLEHFAEPAEFLGEVHGKMNPGGLLYVAVPDMEAMQFRIFGKNWNVISPIAHLQYFNETSLTRLLERCGFRNLERVERPAIPEELAPRWTRLVRKHGGNDSGELVLLASRPKFG